MKQLIGLSHDLKLPLDVVTERLAFLGQSGSGKSYAAMLLAELMLGAGAQVVVLDPVGVWWGLLFKTDGKPSKLPVYVLGGLHGQLPLTPEGGALAAEVIVSKGVSVVLDISEFTTGEMVLFVIAFARRFYELKRKAKSPVHLFLEEAHNVLPQNVVMEDRDPRRNPAVMLALMERVARQGRFLGIGASFISQMPQAVNKKALNQASTVFAMRTLGAHERKAIGAWMADKATDKSQLDLDARLTTLKTGEAWVASPHWLGVFKAITIAPKLTFDSSATPKFGAKAVQLPTLSSVDLSALGEAMEQAAAQVKENDPAALKERIRVLERALTERQRINALPTGAPKVVKVPAIDAKQLALLDKHLAFAATIVDRLNQSGQVIVSAAGNLKTELVAWRGREGAPPLTLKPGGVRPLGMGVLRSAPMRHAPIAPGHVGIIDGPGTPLGDAMRAVRGGAPVLKKGAREMLSVLVSMHPRELTRTQLATLSGLAPSSGTYSSYLSALRQGGHIVEQGDRIGLTQVAQEANREALAEGARQPVDLITLWSRKLKAGARAMLNVLVERYPNRMSRAELAEAVSIVPTSGTFSSYLSALRSNGLMVEEQGAVLASPALFLTREG